MSPKPERAKRANPESTCSRCRFVERDGLDPRPNDVLTCHRFPPTATPVSSYGSQWAGGEIRWRFPPVESTEWCGEFEPVPEPEREPAPPEWHGESEPPKPTKTRSPA